MTIGIFIHQGPNLDAALAEMDKATEAWTMKAARGECSWICADCCMSFAEGMPDACAHGDPGCTSIIERDKREALKLKEQGNG